MSLCPQQLSKKLLSGNTMENKGLLQGSLGFDVHIVIQTDKETQKQPVSEKPVISERTAPQPEKPDETKTPDKKEGSEESIRGDFNDGNYDYTFETFIVGPSNDFTYAACKAVAPKHRQFLQPPVYPRPFRAGKNPPSLRHPARDLKKSPQH